MSSERHFSNKPFRPAKKKPSYWKPILCVGVLGGIWFVYAQYWPTVESWFKPKIHEVHSQTLAMERLQKMLAAWNGTDAELAAIATEADKQVEWKNSAEARDSFTWMLAVEMDRRGMLTESEPMITALLDKKLGNVDKMPAEDKKRLLNVSLGWADEFAARKHDAAAEKLYDVVLKHAPEDAISVRLACLEPLIQYAYDQARFERFVALCQDATSPLIMSMLKEPDDVKCLVKILLLQDTLPEQTTGVPVGSGSTLAKGLLTRFRMNDSPDMGRNILKELNKPLQMRKKHTQLELKEMADQLEHALTCFRASKSEMDCTPETMLALARLNMQMGNLKKTARLLASAEGTAETLGIDTPRILSGSSMKQEIEEMRVQLEKYSQAESLVKRAYEDVNLADAFLKAKDYNQADKYAERALSVATTNTTFVQALQPVIQNIQIKIIAGREQWAEAEVRFAKLIETWDALSDEDKATLQNNLNSIQSGDLYKQIHRDWAEVCKKQKRTTEARRVLTRIGEAPPEQEQSSSSSRRRRNRE